MNPVRLSLVDWTVLSGIGIKGFRWLSAVHISLIKISDFNLAMSSFYSRNAFYHSLLFVLCYLM